MRWCQYVVFSSMIRYYLMQGSFMPSLKSIGLVILEIFKKTYFSPHFWPYFGGHFPSEGTKISKIRSNAEHHSDFQLSENQIRFWFRPPVRQIWLFWNMHYWTNFGTLSQISREPEFSWTWDFQQNVPTTILHDSKLFPEKTNDKIFCKTWKTTKNGTFYHFFPNNGTTRFFFKNPAWSLFLHYRYLTPCKKLEKFNDGKYYNFLHGRTDGRTNIFRAITPLCGE